MRKHLIAGFLMSAALVIAAAPPSQALLGLIRADKPVEDQTSAESSSDRGLIGNVLNAFDRNEAEQKRQEIQTRIEERRAAIAEKLSGRRAEICEQREAAINEALLKRAAVAEQFQVKFAGIEERLRAFVADRKLSVENASALELIMSDKQAEVAAAVSVAKTTSFDCMNTSADSPGQVVKSLVDEQKRTLKEYRDAIKDYAAAVKAAALAASGPTEAVRPDDSAEAEVTQ